MTYDEVIEEIKKDKNNRTIVLPCNFDIRDDSIQILEEIRSMFHNIILRTNCRMFYYKNYLNELI